MLLSVKNQMHFIIFFWDFFFITNQCTSTSTNITYLHKCDKFVLDTNKFKKLVNLTMDNNLTIDNNLEFWMRGVLLSIIGILGLIGNALFIYILWKKVKKSSIDFILIGMSLIAEIKIPNFSDF